MVLNFQLRKCLTRHLADQGRREHRIWIWKQNKSKRSRSAPAISAYLSLPGLSRAPMPTEMYLVGSFNSFYIWFFWPKSSIHRSRGQLPANKECLTSKNHELLKRVLQTLIHKLQNVKNVVSWFDGKKVRTLKSHRKCESAKSRKKSKNSWNDNGEKIDHP